MTDLFQIPESKSPRLKWLEVHGIKTEPIYDDPAKSPFWGAFATDPNGSVGGYEPYARGDTEDEAITNLAKRLGIRLWNETISGDLSCEGSVEPSAAIHSRKGRTDGSTDGELSGVSASAEHVEPSADCQNNG